MAGTNRFAAGNIVGYDGMIGNVKKNCKDFKCWEVEFKDGTRVLHYRELVFLCESQAVYDLGLKM